MPGDVLQGSRSRGHGVGQLVHPLQFGGNTAQPEPLKVRLVKLEHDRPQVLEARSEFICPRPDLAGGSARMRIRVEAGQFMAARQMNLPNTIRIEILDILQGPSNSVQQPHIKSMKLDKSPT